MLLALLWWILTGGELESWLFGAPAVLAATWASLVLEPPNRHRLHLGGLIRFVPFFLWRSLAGGVDVAWRALHPGLAIDPSMETFPLRLPAEGPSRAFFVGTVSLLPGTLSAQWQDDELTVHALRGGKESLRVLEELEAHVALLFGQRLALSPSPARTEDDPA